MIIITTKTDDNTYKARINGFNTTLTREQVAEQIVAGKACRNVNFRYTSLAQLDRYVKTV